MQKLAIALVFILLANLVIGFELERGESDFTAQLSESETEVAREETCRKEGQSCDSSRKCCEGYGCHVLVIGLGYMGSIRCGKLRNTKN
ncbi:uncharacterized protein LOC129984444 isoform X1 [Argiope bruennichi]|uniref:uncharacterized protein LOC129984444 isoform X1 n=1 Tax=Argiope bruennichi TaxID=94029 RepID=UPI002494E30B|nr:uncharacterized protein LOC129984444 isoform X1 [Argiope bruennichi]